MRKFASKDAIGVAVLLILFVLALLILSGTGQSGNRIVSVEDSPDPSIYNDRASGTRGLFEWTERLGYHPLAWRQDWTNLPATASVLICAAPRWTDHTPMMVRPGDEGFASDSGIGALTPADARGVMNWLSAGHTLLLMASQLPENHLIPVSGDDTSDEPASFSDILGLGTQSALSQGKRRDFAPLQPTVLTQGVGSIRLSGRAGQQRLLRVDHDFVVLFGDISDKPVRDEPVAIEFPVGRGRVVAVADSYFACNANLPRAENATFLASVLGSAAGSGETILFDEFHHGDQSSGLNLWTALGRPLQLGIIQLGVAFLVLVIALGARFGMPLPLKERTTHTSGEYVTSLAGLYRSAGATLPALETIYRQFLRDLCSRFGLPPDVSLEQLADIATRRGRLDRSGLRQLLAACERHLDQRHLTDGELLDLVRQMERIRRQLETG